MKKLDDIVIAGLKLIQRYNVKTIPDGERVSRYLFSSNHYAAENSRVKHAAFMAPGNYPDEVSCYRTGTLDEPNIWALSDKYLGRDKTCKGRGDVVVGSFFANSDNIKKLSDNPDAVLAHVNETKFGFYIAPYPHPLHTNLRPYPNVNIHKALHKAIAQVIAYHAKFVPRDESTSN